ncbi:MAG TPA: dTDP-4-dehydrorhamnose reductase [Candidatus Acidoferrales bacterium]|nr:dTDP-4-dehydrorhamnose reductase [Candidatus Acidoferrales bacterium]
MKVLLVGGSGQLGSEIRGRWSQDEIVAPPHSELSLEETGDLELAIDAESPELVVNCAAFHNVDLCESQPEAAFSVNALAVDRAAALCQARDIAFVTISTDYVFDGRASRPYAENDCPNPVSAYGASKLAGEQLVLRRDMKAYVVRTCGVYGVAGSKSKGTFVDRIIAQARAGETPRVVSDVIASPTYAGDLAAALRKLIATGAYGLYHAANPGPVSWYDFASAALELAGVAQRIEPISASQWKAPARRPAFSALAIPKLAALGIAMPPWREGIAAYLRDRVALRRNRKPPVR